MTTPLSDERIAELRYRLKGPVTDDLYCESTEVRQVGRELLDEVERLRAENAGLRQDVEGWQRLVNCQAIYLDRAAKLPERLHQCRAERHALRARIAELEEQDARWQVMLDRIAGQSADNLMRAQDAERRIAERQGGHEWRRH